MNEMIATSLIYLIAQSLWRQSPARTKVEQRIAELLAPCGKTTDVALSAKPPPRKLQTSIEKPELPLQSTSVLPPVPPKPTVKLMHPRSLPEEPPLVRTFHQPEAPQAITMATMPLIRLWSWEAHEPSPLPILSSGVRDRASLADASLEASVAAAQAKLSPVRSQTVPFQPHNLPDPFENSQTIRFRHPHEELAQPPLGLQSFGR